jgi:tetrachloro-p-hydroquinone reductive dehalogenase
MPESVLLYDFPLSICCQMTRLSLVEKGVAFDTQLVDISNKKQQFEPWYLALNPKGVVPTLKVGDEVITDTLRIVPYVDATFDGPSLTPADESAAASMSEWMRDLMAPRFGVLLYSRMLADDGTSGIIAGRGEMLARLKEARPEAAELFSARIEGNAKLQATLADPDATRAVVESSQELIGRVNEALGGREFLVGDAYSLADTFCTAALARFDMQGFGGWWRDGALPNVEAYYARVQARPSWKTAGIVNVSPGKL